MASCFYTFRLSSGGSAADTREPSAVTTPELTLAMECQNGMVRFVDTKKR